MWFPGRWKLSDLRLGGGRLHGEGLRSQAEGMTGPIPLVLVSHMSMCLAASHQRSTGPHRAPRVDSEGTVSP